MEYGKSDEVAENSARNDDAECDGAVEDVVNDSGRSESLADQGPQEPSSRSEGDQFDTKYKEDDSDKASHVGDVGREQLVSNADLEGLVDRTDSQTQVSLSNPAANACTTQMRQESAMEPSYQGREDRDVQDVPQVFEMEENLILEIIDAEKPVVASSTVLSQSEEITTDADDHDFLEAAMKIEETIVNHKADDGGGGDSLVLPDDAPSVSFDPASGLKLQRLLLEVVEEVRMRRARDIENEGRIRQLVKENHGMENKYEEARSRLSNVEQTIIDKVAQAKREGRSELHGLTEAKAKLVAMCDANEKETKALKYEVRTLQLNKYTLERKIRELERKFTSTSNDSETHISQLSELERRCDSITNRASQVDSNIKKLEENVEEAVRVNRKLKYVNEHQNCEIKHYKNQIDQITLQLKEAKVDSANQPLNTSHQINQLKAQITALNGQLTKEKENVNHLQKQLNSVREDYKQVTTRLTEAHHLVSRHVECGNKATAELKDSKQQLEKLVEEHSQLKSQHEELKLRSSDEREGYTAKIEESSKKAADLEDRLETLTQDHGQLEKSYQELENLNTEWAKKNVSLNEQNKQYKEVLNKPKADEEVQACVLMVEAGVDVRPTVEETESQTLSSSLYTTENTSQTDKVTQVTSLTQTSGVEFKEASVQVDIQRSSPTAELAKDNHKATNAAEDAALSDVKLDTDLPSSCPVSSGLSPSSPVLPSSQPLPGSQAPASVDDCQLSPHSRFTAKLSSLLSSQTLVSPDEELKKDVLNNQALELGKKQERNLRLKRRSTESAQDSPSQGDGDIKGAKTERYSFQFLKMPELETQERNLGVNNSEKEISAPKSTSEIEGGAVRTRSLRRREQQCKSKPREVVSEREEPVLTGILTDPGASRPKRSKKVHFSDRIFAQTPPSSIVTIDEYDSDTLFSEDEDESLSLRPSQVTRLENFLIQDISQS